MDANKAQPYDDAYFSSLIQQVEQEFQYSHKTLNAKITEWLARLKLYNNQMRNKEAVGDPLLFTIFQTVFASLYDDRLTVAFTGKNEGDRDVEENLSMLAENDYVEMDKAVFDYELDWDTMFFGRGIFLFTHFDTKTKTPIPENVDPTTFLRDPDATSINGNRLGRNASRFFGREIQHTKNNMTASKGYFNIESLIYSASDNFDKYSLIRQAQDARRTAQNIAQNRSSEYDLKSNNLYSVLQWFTHWEDPNDNKVKKVMVELANNRTKVVRFQILKGDTWPAETRPLYPIAHDWDGVSIPDIVEDKQRARAVLHNLALRGAKYSMYPSYIYNKNVIKNKADLQNVEFNRFIEADGPTQGAIAEVPKTQQNQQMVNFILQTLDTAAQRATATPELQQGTLSKDSRTASELNLVAAKVDTRYSLSAKVFGWSEKKFWQMWYGIYKEHFKENIHEKILRLEGAFGPIWRPFTRENFIGEEDPDVKVESKLLSDARKRRELQDYKEYLSLLLQDPEANRRYALRSLGKRYGYRKDVIDRLLPPNTDELQAEKENVSLSKNKKQPVLSTDNHILHLEIHSKAADTTATYAHIETHKEALRLKKVRPDLFPSAQPQPENPESQANQAVSQLMTQQTTQGTGTGRVPTPSNIAAAQQKQQESNKLM